MDILAPQLRRINWVYKSFHPLQYNTTNQSKFSNKNIKICPPTINTRLYYLVILFSPSAWLAVEARIYRSELLSITQRENKKKKNHKISIHQTVKILYQLLLFAFPICYSNTWIAWNFRCSAAFYCNLMLHCHRSGVTSWNCRFGNPEVSRAASFGMSVLINRI